MNPLVTYPYSAFAISLTLTCLAAGILLFRRTSSGCSRSILGAVGFPALLISLFLFIGAVANRISWAQFDARHAPPGRMVDVGGFKMHVLCEGPINGPSVLWIPGGYGQGLWMHHLHSGLKAERRSCLVDRAGTGWSEPSVAPRRVQTIIGEFSRALNGAGEKGPWVIVGHSLGGALAANFAAIEPNLVSGIVTLDPTPQTLLPEAVRYWLGTPESSTFKAWAVQFGATTLFPSLNPLNTEGWQKENEALRPVITTLAKLEERPSSLVASGPAAYWTLADAHGVIRVPGALGNLPILSIVQPIDVNDPRELDRVRGWLKLENEFEVRNWKALSKVAQQEYPGFSTLGVLKKAPVGTTHNFPIEAPDFVLAEVRQFIKNLP